MCRIASLCLLQRLKGSMSGDAHNFNNIETWAVIKFFFLQGKAPALFLCDNAMPHPALATQKILAYLGFQCLDHPPYSPGLAPSDYYLFPWLKKQLKGCHFSSDTEVIAAAETWLDEQPSEFFFEWLANVRAMS